MIDAFGNQNLFIFPPKKRTWSERSRFSQQSLHAMESFGYKYSNVYLDNL